MNIDQKLFSILSDCVFDLEREVPYASALAMQREGERIVWQNKRQIVEELPPIKGVVLSAFTGRHFIETATNDLTSSALRKATQDLRDMARYEGIRYDGLEVDPGPKIKTSHRVECKNPPDRIPLNEKVDTLGATQAKLRAMDSRIADAVIQYGHTHDREVFVNRNKLLYQHLRRTQAVALVIVAEGARSVSLHTGHCFQGGWEHAHIDDRELESLVSDGLLQLAADRLSPGTYDAIFSPEFAGMFAHEAFGHGTEADMFLKKRAMGQAYMGKEVASPLVNMSDDPSLPGQAGSYLFDHEGEISSCTRIVVEGILTRALTDLNSAMRLNLQRTANGRRESFERKAYTRMSNTFFEAGRHSLDQMLSDIEYGYMLDRPSNGMEDPKGWGIQLEGYLAREIRHGTLTGRVFSPVIVTGTVPELLKSISMVGNEVKISGLGMCGKGHKEWVKVTDGGPYLRLRARLG